MLGPDGDMWTLFWKFVGSLPSSSSMTLGCTEGRGLVLSGCTPWGTMADFSLFNVVYGLLFSSHYLPPLKISWKVALLRLFGSRWCWKMAIEVLGYSGNMLIHAPRWLHFMRKNCRGVDYYVVKFNAIWVSFSYFFGDIDVMSPIMIHWGTKIPSLYSMGFLCASHSWIFMDNHMCTRQG